MTPHEIAARIAAAGISRPLNWDEVSSSAKDLWEERQIAMLNRREARKEKRK